MHRTIAVPRPLRWGLLLLGLAAFGARPAAAQDQVAPNAPPPKVRTETLAPGLTKKISMSTGAVIAKVLSENPKVIRVQPIENDPTAVMVTGQAPGTSRVTFIDVNNRTELVDVHVTDERNADLEKRRSALIKVIHDVAPTAIVDVIVTGDKGDTVILTGIVSHTDSVQPILEAARSYFPIAINGMRIGGVQQVQLEVLIAIVNRSEIRNLNVAFSAGGNRFFLSSIIGGPFGIANATTTAGNSALALAGAGAQAGTGSASPTNLAFGLTSANHNFNGFIQALRSEGLAKVLVDTRATTLSGKPAQIVSGGQTPILTSSGVGAPSVQYKPFGTVVNFLPIVMGNKIHLEVRPEVSALNAANGIFINGVTPTQIPGFTNRSAQVAVQLEDGQTLAIGGLIQNTINSSIQKVPVLGDLPFFGAAFRSTTYNEVEEELLILVTPRLVDALACNQIPKYLPGRETRSPDDFELFLEGILEAPRGPRQVVAPGHGYTNAHVGAPGPIQAAGFSAASPYGAGCSLDTLSTGGPAGVPAPAITTPPTPAVPVGSPADRPLPAVRDGDALPRSLPPAAPLIPAPTVNSLPPVPPVTALPTSGPQRR
jgi:pilus assembly protein CpaC